MLVMNHLVNEMTTVRRKATMAWRSTHGISDSFVLLLAGRSVTLAVLSRLTGFLNCTKTMVMLSHPSPVIVDGARHLSSTLSHTADRLFSWKLCPAHIDCSCEAPPSSHHSSHLGNNQALTVFICSWMKFTNSWLDMQSLFIKQSEKHLIESKHIVAERN
jgi:hypothetical protein